MYMCIYVYMYIWTNCSGYPLNPLCLDARGSEVCLPDRQNLGFTPRFGV